MKCRNEYVREEHTGQREQQEPRHRGRNMLGLPFSHLKRQHSLAKVDKGKSDSRYYDPCRVLILLIR